MSTWTDDRLADYAAMYAEWPEEITRGEQDGFQAVLSSGCIKTPDSRTQPMVQTGWASSVSATFDMLKEDFLRLNLMPSEVQKRPRFTCNGFVWQIYRVGDDSNVDPIIQFWAARQQ